MHEKLINYFTKIADLSSDEINALKESMVIKKYPKGTFLLKEGQVTADTFFVLEGLVRQYEILDGEEITTNFFSEEQWIISLNGFTAQQASNNYLVCLEDTTLVTGNEAAAQALFTRHPGFETISRRVMEQVFGEQQRFLTSYITATPEERYVKLLQTRPGILQRVPQYLIASYIGIKPESLSRIRKRIVAR